MPELAMKVSPTVIGLKVLQAVLTLAFLGLAAFCVNHKDARSVAATLFGLASAALSIIDLVYFFITIYVLPTWYKINSLMTIEKIATFWWVCTFPWLAADYANHHHETHSYAAAFLASVILAAILFLLYAVTLTMLDLQRRDDRKYDRPTGYSAAASSDPETVQKE